MVVESQLRLAVILHADVVGSTALVRKDEQIAHDRIQTAFASFAETVTRYGGSVREVRGDALVAEFSRASDALLAALSAQAANADRNAQIEDGIAPDLRVGVAMGEVVFAEHTVTGAGVVLAQRLEQLAGPGGICISAAIREAVPDRLPLEFLAMGARSIKGFDEPVRPLAVTQKHGYALPGPDARQPAVGAAGRIRTRLLVGVLTGLLLAAAGSAIFLFLDGRHPTVPEHSPSAPGTTSPTRAPGSPAPSSPASPDDQPLPEANSIAVLPFANMSEDPGQEYFSDGLTEDIITDLARISGLLVIARNSTFVYKGQAVDVKAVGRELGVRYVVEGSVRRAKNQVRITAQLIDVESGMHLWANRYDRDITDVFAVQDEVTRTIVSALSVQLTPEEAVLLSETEQVGVDAYDLLLRGNEVMARFTGPAMIEARGIFENVVKLNPRYARAHANIAFTHAQEALFGWSKDIPASIRHGFAAAEEAKRLDPSIPQLHLTVSNLHGAKLEWEEASRVARRTVELEPSYADAHVILAVALTFMGDLESATSAIARAKRLNPHYSFIYLWIEGRILYLSERYEDALALLEEAARRNPDFDQVRIMLAATYAQLERTEDAQWEVEEVLARRPDFTIAGDIRVRGFRDAELLGRYTDGLRRAGFPE